MNTCPKCKHATGYNKESKVVECFNYRCTYWREAVPIDFMSVEAQEEHNLIMDRIRNEVFPTRAEHYHACKVQQ